MIVFRRFNSIKGSLLLHELSFLLIILITASVGIVWAFAWQKSSEESVRLSMMNSHVQNIRGEMYRQLKEVFDSTFLNDHDALREYNQYTKQISTFLQQLYLVAEEGDESQSIKSIEIAYDKFHEETYALLITDKPTEEQTAVLDQQLETYTFTELEKAFNNFASLLLIKQRNLSDDRKKWLAQLIWLIPIPIMVAVSLLFLSRRFVNKKVIKPLGKVIHGARRISKGELDHRFTVEGVDDVHRLASAINLMAHDLLVNRDKLVEAKRQAALGELIPLVAHNIRNPLAGIRAASQVTLDEKLDPQTQEALTDIIIAVDRLERWVTSLLTYLHPIKTNFSHSKLTVIVDNVLKMSELQLAEKKLDIKKIGWLNTTSELAIDINLMEQAVFNLIQNAIEASPESSCLTFEYIENDDVHLLTISDQGKGISFDPIAEEALGNDQAKRLSCGLGIPFALKVIKQHFGELSYSSEQEKGTKAVIRLPK
ncbi:hypothetical protein LCGC14_0992840 [marine sediment metagenome]|uniref:histidine kinase n=1 Tax=marine sediment metagenome TaxID=412755 RepID=A0A0F9NRW2_9ZZZZ